MLASTTLPCLLAVMKIFDAKIQHCARNARIARYDDDDHANAHAKSPILRITGNGRRNARLYHAQMADGQLHGVMGVEGHEPPALRSPGVRMPLD